MINKLKNKKAKVLLENFFSLSILQIANLLLPLLILPYLIKVVGFEKYGIIVLANSLIVYFQSIVDYSFKITATRDIAIFKNSIKKMSIIYCKVMPIKIIFFIVSYISICLIVFNFDSFYIERKVYLITGLMLLGNLLFPDWFFQGIEKMKFITVINVSIKIIFTLLVFIFIKTENDYWIYPLLQVIGLFFSGIIGQYIVFYKFKLNFYFIKWNELKNTIYKNFPIFINQFLPTFYNNTSTFLLGVLTSTKIVGVYDAIKKVVDIVIAFFSVISRVFFPFLNTNKNSFVVYRKNMIRLSILMLVLIIVFSQYIFYYFKIENEDAFTVLIVLALGIVGYVLYDVFGLNYFIINRQDKLVMKNTIIASAIGVLTVYPLVYYFGIIGAAINLTMSRFLMGGLLVLKYYKNE